MSKLTEKLGITPGPWIIASGDVNYIGDPDWFYRICAVSSHRKYPNNQKLIATAPEMLEALIELALIFGNMTDEEAGDLLGPTVKVIEKATSKSWQEIKELLNG